MKITIYRNGNDGGLSIEDGESAEDVTRVIMQSAVSFVVSSVPSDLQEDAINVLSRTVSGMLGDLTAMMAETGEP